MNHAARSRDRSGEIRNFRTWINEGEAPYRYVTYGSVGGGPDRILLPDPDGLVSKLEPFGEFRVRTVDRRWDERLYVRQGGPFFEVYDWKWYLEWHPLVAREEAARTPLKDRLDPWSLTTRLVTPTELERYGKADLRILRNAIFALHGRSFVSADLRQHFKKFVWNLPSLSFREEELSSVERANIATILAQEAASVVSSNSHLP